jgi:hypothetical protein
MWQRHSSLSEKQASNYNDSSTAVAGEVVLTFAVRWCCVVSQGIHMAINFGSLDRSRHFFFQVASQLS